MAPRQTARCYRVLAVEHGAKPSLLARARAQVIAVQQPNRHWRITKNTTGKTFELKP